MLALTLAMGTPGIFPSLVIAIVSLFFPLFFLKFPCLRSSVLSTRIETENPFSCFGLPNTRLLFPAFWSLATPGALSPPRSEQSELIRCCPEHTESPVSLQQHRRALHQPRSQLEEDSLASSLSRSWEKGSLVLFALQENHLCINCSE